HLQHASKALKEEDEFSKFTKIGRQLGYAVYMFYDSFAWAHSTGVYKFNQIKKITTNAARFWLIGLSFSILHGLYKLHQNRLKKDYFERASKSKSIESNESSSAHSEVAVLRRQLIQDLLDLTIPTTSLEYIRLEDGIVGLAGFFSAIIGAKTQWEK
ncbi:19572_t:CDS:2, partial [Racocetra fulgida]